jgi:hypothetical protein
MFSKYSAISFKSDAPLLNTPSVCKAYKSSINATLEPVQVCFTFGLTCDFSFGLYFPSLTIYLRDKLGLNRAPKSLLL